MDPGAMANLFNYPIRCLWKVWVSSYLIQPSWFWSKWFHEVSKFLSKYPGTSAGWSLWAASKMVPAASLASSFIRSFYPVLWPDGVLPSFEYLLKMLSIISSSSAPWYPEMCMSYQTVPSTFLPSGSESSLSLIPSVKPKRAARAIIFIYILFIYFYNYKLILKLN